MRSSFPRLHFDEAGQSVGQGKHIWSLVRFEPAVFNPPKVANSPTLLSFAYNCISRQGLGKVAEVVELRSTSDQRKVPGVIDIDESKSRALHCSLLLAQQRYRRLYFRRAEFL
jgi:hypothetical protein